MNIVTQRRRARLAFAPQSSPAVPSAGQLELTELRLFNLREPVSRRTYTVLRARTRGGLTGFGECTHATADDLDQAQRFWLGKPATSYAFPRPQSALNGAIDVALLDITARACAAPIYRLLGGPTRHKIRAITSVGAESVGAAWDEGFRAVVVEIPQPAARNQGQAFQLAIRKLCAAIRERGADFVLAAGGALTPGDAASVAATAQSFHPLWLDEPCAASSLETIRKISSETVTPLGFGRDITDPGQFQSMLRESMVDVVRPDLAHYGVTGSRRIAALAETYYVAIAPRHEGGPIGTAAALQLAASLPNFFIQHIPFPPAREDREMRAALTGAATERVVNGFVALPKGPGLGVLVSEEALEKYHAA